MEDYKMKNAFKYIITAVAVVALSASCSKFLNRPAEDSYTTNNYYQNDTQVEQSVNYLYNSPWYDVIRFYITVPSPWPVTCSRTTPPMLPLR